MGAKTIEVTVSPKGEIKVGTSGFAGVDCLQATAALEAALGTPTAREMLPTGSGAGHGQRVTVGRS